TGDGVDRDAVPRDALPIEQLRVGQPDGLDTAIRHLPLSGRLGKLRHDDPPRLRRLDDQVPPVRRKGREPGVARDRLEAQRMDRWIEREYGRGDDILGE